MKTVLICHHDDDLNARALPRWLGSFSEVAGIVSIEEKSQQKKNRVKREIKRLGYLRFLDVIAYRLFHRFFVHAGDVAYETRLLDDLKTRYPALPANIPVLTTASPNSPETIKFLQDVGPDLMIARCKVILKPEVFSAARLGTYVMHPGICPEYRNAHGCFWALAESDLDRVGMTLLKVDKGIDTGPVFGFFTYSYDEVADSHVTIQHKTVFENLDRIRDKFLEIEQGTAVRIDTTGRKSGNWGQPWLTRYLRWKKAAKARASAKTFARA
ncbi:MAG: formyl transferase [Deltaproteobacteria bacterium]|nr:formyl transferase [Deltaproteobacteria bacterium]